MVVLLFAITGLGKRRSREEVVTTHSDLLLKHPYFLVFLLRPASRFCSSLKRF
jgi:hypothetical protein